MTTEILSINKSCRKAKPIFSEEKSFIERHLGMEFPDDCWITGGGTKYIWYDLYQKKPLLKFRVDPSTLKFSVVKDNREMFEGKERLTITETVEHERERIENAYVRDLDRLVNYTSEHSDIFFSISISGGKDSQAVYQMWIETLDRLKDEGITPKYKYIFFNTSNETASVYKYIKTIPGIRIINPDIGWKQWIKKNGYALPTVFRRSCCVKYKETPAKKAYPKGFRHISVLGMRNRESEKRAGYEFEMDYEWGKEYRSAMGKTSTSSRDEIKICPIIDWETVDVWLLTLLKNWHIDQGYKYGISRVGCLFCPYSNAYETALIREHYPVQYGSFRKLLRNAYDRQGWSLGWDFESYANAYWKRPISKRSELRKEKTPENIAEFAKERGLSLEMAEKYFNKVCRVRGKSVQEAEIALFLKLFGRYEGQKDDRQPLCVECIAKELGVTKREAWAMAKRFKDQGCALFP